MTLQGTPENQELLKRILNRDTIALSRAITLVESSQKDHVRLANNLLDECISAQNDHVAMRIAVSGAPGVGKSTLIESIGKLILEEGLSLAVLAIDPSSQVSGGSVMGDKTRMQSLSAHPNAFVRPSPAGLHSGGVAERTREALILCETAGFDVVMIETVGVGQSETQVRSMTDLFLLLISPGGGDEMQGIKRGILELADVVVVNKADGDFVQKVKETRAQYNQALRVLFSDQSVPDVLACSALTGDHIPSVWHSLKSRFALLRSENTLENLRRQQNIEWYEQRVKLEYIRACLSQKEIAEAYSAFKQSIEDNQSSVRSAIAGMQSILDRILGNTQD